VGWEVKLPSTIYAIRCTETGRVYIGRTQDVGRRLSQHLADLNGNRKSGDFQKDYNTYGVRSFEAYVLEENVPPELAQEREAAWIREYRATNPRYGYNKNDETPVTGFGRVNYGRPPKGRDAGDVHDKYRQLTPTNQLVIKAVIGALLNRQEAMK
jgi:group I intron endonuclease